MTGLVGSSVNFTWRFSGDVLSVNWGLTKDGKAFEAKLVSLGKSGSILVPDVPPEYSTRVSGTRSGDASSGQVIFTLSSITKDDERSFGCNIEPANPSYNPAFDPVELVVNGESHTCENSY